MTESSQVLPLRQRAVCLHCDGRLLVICHDIFLLVPWVELNLVDARRDRDAVAIHQCLEVRGDEFADIDALDLALCQGVLQSQPGLVATSRCRTRIVDEVAIKLVEAQQFQGLYDGIVCAPSAYACRPRLFDVMKTP